MQSIGRFEIRKTLGRGAQSVVYLGYDPHLQREVALKTLRVASADEGRLLLAEARAVSGLRHPGIVPVFDAGEHRGEPYLVFEYVPGETLAERLREGAMSPEEAVCLMLPVLDALAHAHDSGLVHRDLKPGNILLSTDGAPRLMDFGIATRIAAPADPADPRVLAGTPAYMAPEYIDARLVQPSNDIFAAGLVILEMLTGRRAVPDEDAHRALYRLAHTDIRLPVDAALPDALVDAVHKALARDPARRWQDARQFRRALAQAIGLGGREDDPAQRGMGGTLEFLMRRMRLKTDFPALSGSISAVNRIAGGGGNESNAMLADAVLKDVALTNKILRVVNSAMFRHHGGPVSTVSRAVMILGFEAVRNLAVALLLFENMGSRAQADALREEFVRAMLAAVLARGLAADAGVRNAEEAFICALFHDLGRMLALLYFPEEAQEIRRLTTMESLTETRAALRVLGLTYEMLGMEVARVWGLPHQIVRSQRRPGPGPIRPSALAAERTGVLTALANGLADAVAQGAPRDRRTLVRQLGQRFGGALHLDDRRLEAAIDEALDHIHAYAATFHLPLQKTRLGHQIVLWSGRDAAAPTAIDGDRDALPNALPRQDVEATLRLTAADDPDHALTVLAAGIQDVSNSLVGEYKLNDLLRMILETMYRGIGFRRVLLALKDPQRQVMQGRFGFGPDVHELARRFRFALDGGDDVFQLVLDRGVDLLVDDVAAPNIRDRIPAWHGQATPARTFALFPLMVKDRPMALIYAEAERAGDIVIPERELGMLRTLRNQAVLAIRQTS